MKILSLIFIGVILMVISLNAEEENRHEIIRKESEIALEKSLKIAKEFYHLNDGEDLKEITDVILNSTETEESMKQKIIKSGRRFFLFKYPSDGFNVKGYISFIPNYSEKPLLILLRGGNRFFGLMHPGSCIRDYTIIATTYRGGVSEGEDEFGGNEVNDVANLLKYFPILQKQLGFFFCPNKKFILGASRGAMEMFLALGRSFWLQNQVEKAVSLSGMLDINESLKYRQDMKKMFEEDFGLIPNKNEAEWIKLRNPLEMVPNIRKDLPFLIIQGTKDLRVNLEQGYNMVKKLEENGNPVTYLEIPNGNHSLTNYSNRAELIADWFEGK